MLNESMFAFLVMTAEDGHVDSTVHARENVIHEVGLFQAKLGRRSAIVLLEQGCKPFSNIDGLVLIEFTKNHIENCFQTVREVLEREGLIPSL